MNTRAFSDYGHDRRDGLLAALSTETFYAWSDAPGLRVPRQGATVFGYVEIGMTAVCDDDNEPVMLDSEMYFCIPTPCTIIGGSGIAIIRENYDGLRMFGGPIEQEGRLKYIDGCTDSLLIPPVRRGDPCLNLLYFPPKAHPCRQRDPRE